MKNLLIILLCIFLSASAAAQIISEHLSLKAQHYKLGFKISDQDENFRHFPLRFGVEFAAGAPVSNGPFFIPGLFGFFDINMNKKIWFLKFEYGTFFEHDSNYGNDTYASAGVNYSLFNFKKNIFYLHAGLFVNANKSGGAIGPFASFRYLHSFNDYLGFVASVRYPWGSFKSLMLTAGFQFPAN